MFNIFRHIYDDIRISIMVKIITKPEPYCPDCGAKMRLRRPKADQDWPHFWGCSTYPDCKGTRNIDSDGKPADDSIEVEDWPQRRRHD